MRSRGIARRTEGMQPSSPVDNADEYLMEIEEQPTGHASPTKPDNYEQGRRSEIALNENDEMIPKNRRKISSWKKQGFMIV